MTTAIHNRVRPLVAIGGVAVMVLAGIVSGPRASAVPVQPFSDSGPFAVNVLTCYGGSPPAGGSLSCGPGSSQAFVPLSTTLPVHEIVELPIGSRLIGQAVTFIPADGTSEWQLPTVACGPVDGNNDCTAGSSTGDYTARVDFLCDNGADIMAGPGSIGGSWPDPPSWEEYLFSRTAAGPGFGGGGEPFLSSPNGYVPETEPFPYTFSFRSLDTAALTRVFLSGSFPLDLPVPLRAQLASYESGYPGQAGLVLTATTIAPDPRIPPDDSWYQCFDSPQDSVISSQIITPNANRVIPRWTILESAPDLRETEVGVSSVGSNRVIDWSCVTVGAGEPDADGDCLPDALDPDGADQDIDNDSIVDGIEPFLGSSITSPDTDSDGANDWVELFRFTNPANPDSDGDGSLDKPDDGLDQTPGTAQEFTDTMADDNCPAIPNASQANNDALNQSHGNGTGSEDPGGTSTPSSPNIGGTFPNKDALGDACDLDDDNDELPDVAEPLLTIVPWSGFTDPGGLDLPDTTVCAGPGVGGSAPLTTISPLDGDSDDDLVLDGVECRFASRPDLANVVVATCGTAPVDSDGCARPGNALSGGDADGDRLYQPGQNASAADGVERFYRTRNINTGVGSQVSDIENCAPGFCIPGPGYCGPDGVSGNSDSDSDCDGLRDGWEVQFYGTSPTNPDTDGDNCSDGQEVADVNGDRKVNSADTLLVNAVISTSSYFNADGTMNTSLSPGPLVRANRDFNKDRFVNSGDLSFLNLQMGDCAAVIGTVTPAIASAIHDPAHGNVTGGTVPDGTVVHHNVVLTGSPVPGGTVDFNRYATADCTGTANAQSDVPLSGGSAESSGFTATAGVLSYRVHYDGSGQYAASDGPCDTLTVSAPPAAIDVTGTWQSTFSGAASGSCNSNYTQSGSNLVIDAVCDIAGAATLTGTINLNDRTYNATGSNPFCGTVTISGTFDSSATSASGTATCMNVYTVSTIAMRDCTTTPCPTLVLTPLSDSQATGTTQGVFGTVTINGGPVSGASIVFSIASGPHASTPPGARTTNSSGVSSAYSYASTSPGTDTIMASVYVNGKLALARSLKTWYGLSVTPAGAGAMVGSQHSVTTTVQNGSASSVTFSVAGANTVAPTSVPVSSGVAVFTYTGAFVGTDTITATAVVNGSTVSGTATMSWSADQGGKIFPVAGGTAGDGAIPTAAALSAPFGMVLDAATGRVYVADTGHHRVRRIDPGVDGIVDGSPDETITTVAGTGAAGFSGDTGQAVAAQLNSPSGVTLDAAGNLFIADTNNHRVRKVTAAGVISTVAGTGTAGHTSDSGTATSMRLNAPDGLTVDASGNLFISDSCNHRVRRLTAPALTTMTTIAGSGPTNCGGTGEFAGDGGTATSARMNRPSGLGIEGGTLLIADRCNHRIRALDLSSGIITTFAGSGDPGFGQDACDAGGFGGDAGLATSAQLDRPEAVAVAGGVTHIADAGNHVVRAVSGGTISTVAGAADVAGFADGSSGTARFDTPRGLAADSASGLLIADSANNRVRRLALANVSTVAGTGSTSFCGDLYVAISSSCLDAPEGVAIDAAGNLYIADTANNRVRFISVGDATIRTVAGSAVAGYCGDAGAATSACLSGPADVEVLSDGSLVISDRLNNRIRKVTPDGDGVVDGDPGDIITTLIGDGTPGVNDGALASARVNLPRGLARSGDVLFVADTENCRIREISLTSSSISTIAGTGTCGANGDGSATTTQLNQPRDVAVAPADGSLYIADTANCRVRRLSGGGIVSVVGNACGFSGDGGAATSATLTNPSGLAFGPQGGLVIADQGSHRLRSVSPGPDGIVNAGAGETIVTIAGGATPTPGFCGDPDPAAHYATQACLNAPSGLVRKAGDITLYLVDAGNNRVRKIQADCDIDGLIDSQESGPGDTEPCTADTDSDGHRDPQSASHSAANGDPNSDNCPSVANETQTNANGNFVDQSPPYTQDDRTWINSDIEGDACDADDDNDGITDANEVSGASCAGQPTNAVLLDSDGDRFDDGAECFLGTNPNSTASKPGSNPNSTAACGGAGVDSDGDRISDRIENCAYNSNPGVTDTDGDAALDGARDGCEVASINTDRVVNSGDQLLLAQELIRVIGGGVPVPNIDLNKDGNINSGDQLLLAFLVSPPGQCP